MLPSAGQNWLPSSMPAPEVDHMFKGTGKEIEREIHGPCS